MDLDFLRTKYEYNELQLTFVNYDLKAIKAFLKHLGKEKFQNLLQKAQINFVPEKLTDFYFKFSQEKCFLYIIEPEGNFKITEVPVFYIPRQNWQLIISPKIIKSGEKSIVPYVND